MNIAICIYNEAEVLDFFGPFEVFSAAARVSGNSNLFTTFLVAETRQAVTAWGGTVVHPTYSIRDHPEMDVLVVAGSVHSGEMTKRDVLSWIKGGRRGR